MKRLLLLTLVSSVQGLSVFAASETAPAVDRPRVILQEIKNQEDKKRIIIPVKVEAKIQSLVSADIEGHVTKILKPLGSVVKSGETILILENKDPGFTYAAVPVRSPVSGVVSQIWITQMTKVSRGDKLFTVINPKTLKLSAEFPSQDLGFIASGLTGEFKIDGQKDITLPIRVVGVSPLVDARTGTASAELEFSANSKTILPPIGSIGQATFEIKQGSIMMIPENSLVFQDGKPMVRVLKGENEFSKKSIELGEQRDGLFVVKSGIASGEKIVVRSSRPLKEGDLIEVESKTEKTQ